MLGAHRVWVPVLDQAARDVAPDAKEPAFSAVLVELRVKQAGKVENLDGVWSSFATADPSGLNKFIAENRMEEVPWLAKPSRATNFPGSTREALEWKVTPRGLGHDDFRVWGLGVDFLAKLEVDRIHCHMLSPATLGVGEGAESLTKCWCHCRSKRRTTLNPGLPSKAVSLLKRVSVPISGMSRQVSFRALSATVHHDLLTLLLLLQSKLRSSRMRVLTSSSPNCEVTSPIRLDGTPARKARMFTPIGRSPLSTNFSRKRGITYKVVATCQPCLAAHSCSIASGSQAEWGACHAAY